jgi:hypothetical protein
MCGPNSVELLRMSLRQLLSTVVIAAFSQLRKFNEVNVHEPPSTLLKPSVVKQKSTMPHMLGIKPECRCLDDLCSLISFLVLCFSFCGLFLIGYHIARSQYRCRCALRATSYISLPLSIWSCPGPSRLLKIEPSSLLLRFVTLPRQIPSPLQHIYAFL